LVRSRAATMLGNALCTYMTLLNTSGFPSWPFRTPVENVHAALRLFTFALLIWVSGLYRCRSYVRPVIVHSPGPWATADAASTIMLVAIPPDNSLKRFIADLMLRMRVVGSGLCDLPVRVANPRGQRPGARVPNRPQPSSEKLQPRMPPGI